MSEEVVEPSAETFALEYIEENTSPDDPWTGKRFIVQDGRESGFESSDMKATVNALVDNGEVFSWHGLLAPRDPEILRSIIEQEREAEITRTILIGNVNQVLQEERSEEVEDSE